MIHFVMHLHQADTNISLVQELVRSNSAKICIYWQPDDSKGTKPS